MPVLTELLLPILVAAAFVFVVSSIVHMATPMHKGDFRGLPDEEELLSRMRDAGLRPGQYMFPHCESMQEMGSDEMREKLARGPVGTMLVAPNGGMNMGKSLLTWFLFTVVVSTFVAYLATLSLPKGVEGASVFRLTATAGILGYAFASVPESIWKGQSWGVTLRFAIDGVLYGLATSAAFVWLWPQG